MATHFIVEVRSQEIGNPWRPVWPRREYRAIGPARKYVVAFRKHAKRWPNMKWTYRIVKVTTEVVE